MKQFLAVLLIMCSSLSCLAQNLKLIPYRKGDLWGYADPGGKVVIQPTYERTYFFTLDSVARVRYKGKYGFINPQNEWRLQPAFENASDFYMGIASVENDGRKYCINLDGSEDECNPAEEDLAPAEENAYNPFLVEKDSVGYMVIMDGTNDTIPDRFDDVKIIGKYFLPVTSDFAVVRKKALYGAYNQQGMMVAPVEFKKLDILDMDSYKAVKDAHWGVNDANGSNILPFEYDSVTKVTELLFLEDRLQKNNHFIVSKKQKFGVLDSYRRQILKIDYDVVRIPKACACPTEYVVSKNGLYGVTDFKGKFIVPMKYKDIQPFQSAQITAVVTASGKEGYISRDGKEYFVE